MAIHNLCRQTGQHDWVMTAADGWFSCQRSHCSVYATCPACLGVRVPDTLVRFCMNHLSEVQFLAEYPLAEPVPVEASPVLEQYTLW